MYSTVSSPSCTLLKHECCLSGAQLLPHHPAVVAIAAQLMGEVPRPPRKVRGFYSIFPAAAGARPAAEQGFVPHQDAAAVSAHNAQQVGSAMHVDGAAGQLAACVYLTDVAAGGGGLTVLPRSCHALGAHFYSEYNYDPMPTYAAALGALTARAGTDAVEVAAPAGSVVFFHGRLAHAAGVNTHRGTHRVAVFCDFQKDRPIVDVPPIDGTSFRRLRADEGWDPYRDGSDAHPRSQHWVDTREKVADRPPPADIFDDWGALPK
eukprot:SAG22_NODE_526_length_9463_cov_8.286523_9_plen_263_part_00